MATTTTTTEHRPIISKPSKWFSNKNLKLTFPGKKSSKSTSPSSSSPNSPFTGPISPSPSTNKEHELREVFRYFDGDGDGGISASELRAYFGSIGEYMSHDEAAAAISDLDSDGDGLLDFGDFVRLMSRDGGGGDDDEDLKKAFEMFELEKGVITPRSLQRMLHRLGDAKSYDDCVTMIQVFDTDGNGVLDFNEFHRMMA